MKNPTLYGRRAVMMCLFKSVNTVALGCLATTRFTGHKVHDMASMYDLQIIVNMELSVTNRSFDLSDKPPNVIGWPLIYSS